MDDLDRIRDTAREMNRTWHDAVHADPHHRSETGWMVIAEMVRPGVTDEQVERACALAHGIVTGEGGGSGWFTWQQMVDRATSDSPQMVRAWRKAMRAVLESGGAHPDE